MLEDTSEGFIELKNDRNFVYSEELMQFEDLENKKSYKL
jgi:hypothetical protein